MDNTYHQTPASGFYALLEYTVKLFCERCNGLFQFRFVKDDGIYEVYKCPVCGKEQRYAVR